MRNERFFSLGWRRGLAIACIVAMGLGTIVGSGGGGGPPSNPATRVELSSASMLFTGAGQTQQVTVRAFDATGQVLSDPRATFSSSRPTEISVDAAGIVRAEVGVGSALVTAVVDGISARPILVAAVELAANARAVRDAEVVGQPVQDFTTAPGLGRRHTLTLAGLGPITPGSILVGVESKTFAGRVVSATPSASDTAVTLELIPINEIFRNVSIAVTLTPDQVASLSTRSLSVTAASDRKRTLGERRIAADTAGVTCTPSGSLNVLSVNIAPKVTSSFDLIVDHGITDGVTKQYRFLLEGTVQLDFDATTTLGTGSGEIDCRLRVKTIDLAAFSPLFTVYGPAINVDMQFRLDGKLSSNASIGLSGTTNKVSLRAGFAKDDLNGYTNLSGFDPWSPHWVKRPSLDLVNASARAEVGVFAGLALDLVLTSPLMSWIPLVDSATLELPLIDASLGFGFDSSWGATADAAADDTYKPEYQFAIKRQIGMDSDLTKRISAVLSLTVPTEFSFSILSAPIVLARSPDALHIVADRATFAAGELVNFAVELDPVTSSFLGYNVEEVRIYELIGGSTAVQVASTTASDGQWSFSIPWIATHAGSTKAGAQALFHAFVVPKLFSSLAGVLPLELGTVIDAPLVSSQPTISTQPRDTPAIVGGTASFTVVAAGQGTLSYQWFKGLTAAPGLSNSRTYVTPTLKAGDSGSVYTVVVSNVAGSATSAPATLTVSQPVQASPDLTVQDIGLSSATVAAGASLQVRFTIANAGPAAAAASITVIRINQSTTSPAGANLASIPIPPLAGVSSVTTGASVAAPSVPGTYHVWVIADNASTSGQSAGATANDTAKAAGTLTVTSAPTVSPDLVASSLTFSPGSVAPGGAVQVNLAVTNLGPSAAGASTAVVRINQSTFSSSGSNLAAIGVPALSAKSSAGLPAALVSAPLTPGTYRVWVVLDNNSTAGQNAVAAANDFVLASGILTVIAPPTSPNLVIQNLTFSPNSVAAGGSVQMSFVVANVGNGPAAASIGAIRINQLDASAAGFEAATFDLPAVPVGGSVNVTRAALAPTTAGAYWVWAVADKNGTSGESAAMAADNAARATGMLTVAGTPSLPVFTTPLQNVLATEGQTATFTAAVSGTGPLSYQWRRNGVNVACSAGTNCPSYTTPVTTLADSGAIYTVAVSNVAGAVTSNNATLTVVPIPTGPEFEKLAAGYFYSLAVKADGTLWGTGYDFNGQLGIPGLPNSQADVWTQVPGLSGIASVAAGQVHSLAVSRDGLLWVTGGGAYGALGLGDTLGRTVWTQVAGLSGIKRVAAGITYSLALTIDGAIWATGNGFFGEFGMVAPNPLPTWTLVPGTSGFTAIATGNGYSLALKNDGSVWGTGLGGGLGFPPPIQGTIVTQWTQVSALSNVVAIALGTGSSMAVTGDGSLWATGGNRFGQLGLGDLVDRTTWTKTNLTNVIGAACGYGHCFALKGDGTVLAAGSNESLQLGVGSRALRFNTWTPVTLPAGAKGLAAGFIHSLAVMRGGAIWGATSDAAGASGIGLPIDPALPDNEINWRQAPGVAGF